MTIRKKFKIPLSNNSRTAKLFNEELKKGNLLLIDDDTPYNISPKKKKGKKSAKDQSPKNSEHS